MTEHVAVIGAGPGGLVAARWLLGQGFEVTLFERQPTCGGQWTGAPGHSGMWAAMRANTSRVLTAFGDLDPGPGDVFPTRAEVFDYLRRYATLFGLDVRTRFGTTVERLERAGDGWLVGHTAGVERFDRVVVASGRFHSPTAPDVPGLADFAGPGGVESSYDYREPERYAGLRVLVAGGAISALEVAAELVAAGAARVVLTQRKQRYVLPKFAAGVPSDHRIFTRYGVWASERLTPTEVDRQLRELVVEAGGSPEQYGAPAPDPSLFTAGVTLSQNYLPLVADGRITVRPWMTGVSGATVTFPDADRAEEFDAVVLATGFEQRLPFLDEHVRTVVGLDAVHLDSDRFTFHPDLPNLAFVGMWDQSGGYFVPLELQARWIAYTWGGAAPAPSEPAQRAAVAAYRARRGLPQKTRMNLAAVTFARAATVEPDLDAWPELRRALLFGPLAPSSFRLDGPDALSDAAARFARDAAAFGAITTNTLTEREGRYLSLVTEASGLAPTGRRP